MTVLKSVGVLAATVLLSACSESGNMTLESGARKIATKGNPFVTVNNGGRAHMEGAGGVTGWVSVQAVSSGQYSSTDGTGQRLIMNKAAARR